MPLLAAAALLLVQAAALGVPSGLAPRHERSFLARVKKLHSVAVPSLENEVLRMEEELRVQVDEESHKLDASLRASRAKNKVAAAKNERITKAIAVLQASSASLRSEGEQVLHDCELLEADIAAVSKNNSVAGDFLDDVMNQSEIDLWQAPEVQVLAELDAKDQHERSDLALSQALKQIAPEPTTAAALAQRRGPRPKAALLQVPGGVEDTLSSLLSSVEDFRKKQNKTFQQLHASYDLEMSSLNVEYASLMKAQARLNATRVQARDQKNKLSQAVGHLRNARGVLLDRSKSIRRFAAKMGAELPPLEPLSDEFFAKHLPLDDRERAEHNRRGIGWGAMLARIFGGSAMRVPL